MTFGLFRSTRGWSMGAALLTSLTVGCAGHSAKTVQARAALDANQPAQARKLLNQELKVTGADEIPVKEKKGTALLVLDRSMVSQALEDYEASSADLQYADKKVEMLDMSRTAVDDIGKYVFSDDAGPYQAPPYEMVMVNTMNIVNYLARRDLNGARIEARRMSIVQDYLRNNENPAVALNAPGGYLAGFVFERSGRPDIALRYYDEALAHADFQTLVEPVARLSGLSSYSTPRLREFLNEHGAAGLWAEPVSATVASNSPSSEEAAAPSSPEGAALPSDFESSSPGSAPSKDAAPNGQATPAQADSTEADSASAEEGELLVIVNYGRVPAKIAKRVPIGLALTYATLYLSPSATSTANRLAAQGLVTWVNYPELEEKTRAISAPTVRVDGKKVLLEGAAAVDLQTRKAFEEDRGKIVASAITRMITRVVAGEAAGAAARAAADQGWVGALVSLGTQAALTAADTPDTRSWSTLPARIAVSRVRLPPGEHEVTIAAQGASKETRFTLEPGGWQAVVLTVLR